MTRQYILAAMCVALLSGLNMRADAGLVPASHDWDAVRSGLARWDDSFGEDARAAPRTAESLFSASRLAEETPRFEYWFPRAADETKSRKLVEERFLGDLAATDWIGYSRPEASDVHVYGLNDFNLVIPEPGQALMLACAAACCIFHVRRSGIGIKARKET